jgi:DNA-binding transcriptional ArsR family regulator
LSSTSGQGVAFICLKNTLVTTNVFLVPDVLSAAAEPTRRRILQLLASGPSTVSDLAANFTVTRSAISQHLGVLTEVGLVTSRKEGRQRIYSELPEGMSQLRLELERFWTTELDRLFEDAAAGSSDP